MKTPPKITTDSYFDYLTDEWVSTVTVRIKAERSSAPVPAPGSAELQPQITPIKEPWFNEYDCISSLPTKPLQNLQTSPPHNLETDRLQKALDDLKANKELYNLKFKQIPYDI